MKTKILVFGNPLVKKDNLVLKILPELKKEFPKVDFKEFDSTEDLHKEGRELRIIDVVEGVHEVKLLSFPPQSLDVLETNKIYSMHDFDLGYNLKLLEKMNLIDKVEILCIPTNISEQEAFNQSQLILRKWVAQLIQGS
jgi:Ni,Fe-hydrogenase maturation factor